ncbi:unnamed protein product, partial [Timema podura]|nr:unnamed protein product [Timema podura]
MLFINAAIEQSFSLNKDCLAENLHEDSLIAHRITCVAVTAYGGLLNMLISKIIMCMFCGDPYSVENILGPLLSHQCCFLSGDRSIILETFLGDSKRKVEVIISSFHGANAFREELVHGFILVYSTKRKASLATLNTRIGYLRRSEMSLTLARKYQPKLWSGVHLRDLRHKYLTRRLVPIRKFA